MVITPGEVDRRITTSIYCSKCGYNLKTLPYLYRCPECGSEYNARGISGQGIFRPYELKLPGADLFSCFFFIGIACMLIIPSINPPVKNRLVIGGIFVLGAFFFGLRVYRGVRAYWRYAMIAKNVDDQEKH